MKNNGHTLDIDVNGVPECICSDCIRPASGSIVTDTCIETELSDEGNLRLDAGERAFSTPSNGKEQGSSTEAQEQVSLEKESTNSIPGKTSEEFVIEKLEKRGKDKSGKEYVLVKWY